MTDTVRRRVMRQCAYRRDTQQCKECRHAVEHGDGIGCRDVICEWAQDDCRSIDRDYPRYAEYQAGFDGDENA